MIGPVALIREIPDGYEQACFETGAIERKRGIKSPGELMLLNLVHLISGCSLMEISEIAHLGKFGEISDVAFMKRFQNSNEWFKWIISHLQNEGYISYNNPKYFEKYRIVAVDASDVSEKGRSRRVFRLHFALDIGKLQAYQYNITTNAVGESLTNFNFKRGDLVLADRAYGTIRSIEHCIEEEADCILRLRSNAFALYNDEGQKIDLLKEITEKGNGSLTAYIHGAGKHRVRVCFKRKSELAIEESHKRIKSKESRKQITVSKEAKTFNEYIVLVTTISEDVPYDAILDLYRFRWQIELFFKRLKSIMDYGELPKKTTESIFSWLNGKLMIALLVEKMMSKMSFSPQEEFPAECLERDEDDYYCD